jgi:hypothetical protein
MHLMGTVEFTMELKTLDRTDGSVLYATRLAETAVFILFVV